MIRVAPIGIASARELVDFGAARSDAAAFADEQLQGAVALHNILAENRFAYLADEVGKGKTYIALGVMGLLRHYHPGARILVISPRANIQEKWDKELKNFAANNWRIDDGRVRSLQGSPASPFVSCSGLLQLVREARRDARRDFLVRMTSFSLSLAEGDRRGWKRKREELLRELRWLPRESFDLRDKARFKDAYARAINAVLPHFDLVVIDEAHNLKHGFGPAARTSSRNRILGLALGRADADAPEFSGCGARAGRVLLISATPLESDYREIWNQLDVVGMGHRARKLKEIENVDELKRYAGSFMVRRLTNLEIGGRRYTKNMYRREWRHGGVDRPGEPLRLADERQRLTVGLVQKKVMDVLALVGRKQGKRFSRQFQMGMLASFESFFQTSKVKVDADADGSAERANFDQAESIKDAAEREGLDVQGIDALARSYRRRFGAPLPHPKMDAVADSVARSMLEGEKTLVFVRRVASVPELKRKIADVYDSWLIDRLRRQLGDVLSSELEPSIADYRESLRTLEGAGDDDDDRRPPEEDRGGRDTFFAWFFRGDRDLGVMSGPMFRERRLNDEDQELSAFFDDNYLTWLVAGDNDVVVALASQLDQPVDSVRSTLRDRAYRCFRARSKAKKFPFRRVFRAYQEAGVSLLAEQGGDIGARAETIRRLHFGSLPMEVEESPPGGFPDPDRFLVQQTFFTRLAADPLREELWPWARADDFVEAFTEREQRRELLTSLMTLGHPFVDLWCLAMSNRGTVALRGGGGDQGGVAKLADQYLELLRREKTSGELSSRAELSAAASHFHLIRDANFPDLREKELAEVPRYFQSALARQTPVGGMFGKINKSLIRQFRMPGYPYALITTDVAQEGEDLHLFAARVVHYGITWTPSAMEQRTGRVDRIGSLTHRRLSKADTVDGNRLHVQFPYLSETVELAQVREVFRRMDLFMKLLHEGFGATEDSRSEIDLSLTVTDGGGIPEASATELETPFDVQSEHLHEDEPVAIGVDTGWLKSVQQSLREALAAVGRRVRIDWSQSLERDTATGTVYLRDGELMENGVQRPGARIQPFGLGIRSCGETSLARFVSPVGRVEYDDEDKLAKIFRMQRGLTVAKLCLVDDTANRTFNLEAVVDVILHPPHLQEGEVVDALRRCALCADEVEREILSRDEPLETFEADMIREIGRG